MFFKQNFKAFQGLASSYFFSDFRDVFHKFGFIKILKSVPGNTLPAILFFIQMDEI